MLHSAVSVLVVAQSSSEIAEGLMNNPVYIYVLLRTVNIRHCVHTYYHDVTAYGGVEL